MIEGIHLSTTFVDSMRKEAELYLSARNLLDTQEIVSRRPYGARPNAPRTVLIGLKYSL